jgi:transcriptional regulator with PAS, ATPase and Fis domain
VIDDIVIIRSLLSAEQEASKADRAKMIEAVEEAHEEDHRLSLYDLEAEMVRKALDRHKGRRKEAAAELGISERTLYRKIKQLDL